MTGINWVTASGFSSTAVFPTSHQFIVGTSSFSYGWKHTLTFSKAIPGICGKNQIRKHPIVCALQLEKSYAALAVQGRGRPTMEDTYYINVDARGSGPSFFGVFDGHGGDAVAKLLQTSFWSVYKNYISGSDPVKATTSAYLEFDKLTLAQPKGFLGALKERGVGGSRCGATAATIVLLPSEGGAQKLVAANVGDARVVLSRNGHPVQLTFDHKPDVEHERQRIEAKNPTPKKPLVVNVGGTWRVGGLLALSRAFGNAYLKGSADGKSKDAPAGLGLIAEPEVQVEMITPEDDVIILATDGLWEKVGNQEAIELCHSKRSSSPEAIVDSLVKIAQQRGATDDIAVIVIQLSQN